MVKPAVSAFASSATLLLSSSISSVAATSWQVPKFITPIDDGEFGGNQVWEVGAVKTLEWTTSWTEYTIALWQKSLTSAAKMGDIIFETTNGADIGSLAWTVSPGALDLDDSPVFFFWIFEGPSGNQGNTSNLQQSSAYFNMTTNPDEDTDATNTATQDTTTTTTSLAETQTSATTATTEQETTDPTATTTSSSSSDDVVDDDDPTSQSPDQSLSRAAQVGIGVGVSVAVLGAAGAALLFWRYMKHKERLAAAAAAHPPSMLEAGAWDYAAGCYVKKGPPQELDGGTISELGSPARS